MFPERMDLLIRQIRGRLLFGMNREEIADELEPWGYSQAEIYLAYTAATLANTYGENLDKYLEEEGF